MSPASLWFLAGDIGQSPSPTYTCVVPGSHYTFCVLVDKLSVCLPERTVVRLCDTRGGPVLGAWAIKAVTVLIDIRKGLEAGG